jgi:hypothetical protein
MELSNEQFSPASCHYIPLAKRDVGLRISKGIYIYIYIYIMVKQSLYTPWRRLGGEEV